MEKSLLSRAEFDKCINHLFFGFSNNGPEKIAEKKNVPSDKLKNTEKRSENYGTSLVLWKAF